MSTLIVGTLSRLVSMRHNAGTSAEDFDYRNLPNVKMRSPLRVKELLRFYIRGLDAVNDHSFIKLMLWVPFTFKTLNAITLLLPDTMHSFVFKRYGKPKAEVLEFFSELAPHRNFTLRFEVDVGLNQRKPLPVEDWNKTSAGHRIVIAYQEVVQQCIRRSPGSDNFLASDLISLGTRAANDAVIVKKMEECPSCEGNPHA